MKHNGVLRRELLRLPPSGSGTLARSWRSPGSDPLSRRCGRIRGLPIAPHSARRRRSGSRSCLRRDGWLVPSVRNSSRHIYGRPGREIWGHARLRSTASGPARTADLQLIDEHGLVVAEVTGLESRPVDPESLSGNKSSGFRRVLRTAVAAIASIGQTAIAADHRYAALPVNGTSSRSAAARRVPGRRRGHRVAAGSLRCSCVQKPRVGLPAERPFRATAAAKCAPCPANSTLVCSAGYWRSSRTTVSCSATVESGRSRSAAGRRPSCVRRSSVREGRRGTG